MKKFIGIISVLTFLFTFTSCDVDNPKLIGFEDLKMQEMSAKKLAFDVAISTFNPNNKKITIRKSKLDVYLNGTYIGKGILLDKYKMPKKDDVTQTVPIEIELKKGALFSLTGLITRKEVELKIEGKLNVSYGGLPFSKKISEAKMVNPRELGIDLGSFLNF